MPAPAQVGVRVVRVRRKQAELSKNARLRKRLQKLRESSRKLLGIHKVAPEPTFDDKLDWFIKDEVELGFSVIGVPTM